MQIFMNLARSFDVLHQINAVAAKRAVNAAQNVQRLGLIVNGIERCDQVERLQLSLLVEPAEIGHDKFYVAQFLLSRLLPRGQDRFARQVYSGKTALRIKL